VRGGEIIAAAQGKVMAKGPYFELGIAALQQHFNFSPHSPMFKAVRLIPEGAAVLEIGCARGYVAKELSKKNCRVTGIEIDSVAADAASKYCRQIICGNIEQIENFDLKDSPFDYILCLDILEHLARPDLLLEKIGPYLKDEGYLIVNLPNIARLEHRLKLLFGNFDYDIGGALSKGHLRFFTRKTTQQLLETSGYRIVRVGSTGLGSRIRVWPTLLSFSFLIMAQKE
jgi:2-polyprenyl-3-methyl-5-hydroxy-6-metoxy-1,4-benzoquinol methylase